MRTAEQTEVTCAGGVLTAQHLGPRAGISETPHQAEGTVRIHARTRYGDIDVLRAKR